jgi:hypothetical protein
MRRLFLLLALTGALVVPMVAASVTVLVAADGLTEYWALDGARPAR